MRDEKRPFFQVSLPLVVLAAIILLGLFLRLRGVFWELPYIYHPDEPQVFTPSIQIVRSGDLAPHFYVYPGFTVYINSIAYFFYTGLKILAGRWHSFADLPLPQMINLGVGMISDPRVVVIGRLISLAAGMGSTLLSYKIAREISGSIWGGILAAGFSAFSNGEVVQSHLILPNVFVAFFGISTIWFSLRILKRGAWSDYALAGVCAGLAVASKYNGAILAVAPLLAHFLRAGGLGKALRDLRWLILAPAALLAFALFNPAIWLDSSKFFEGVWAGLDAYRSGWPGSVANPPLWYLTYMAQYEALPALGFIAGLLVALRQRRQDLMVVASFPLVYYIFLNSLRYYNDHTLMHLFPALHAAAGAGWVLFCQALLKNWPNLNKKLLTSLAAFLVLVFWGYSGWLSYRNGDKYLPRGVYSEAREWIQENIPAGSRIAYQPYTPWLDANRFVLVPIYSYEPLPLSWFAERQVDYVIVSSSWYARYYAAPDHYPDHVRGYNELFAQLQNPGNFSDRFTEITIYTTPWKP